MEIKLTTENPVFGFLKTKENRYANGIEAQTNKIISKRAAPKIYNNSD